MDQNWLDIQHRGYWTYLQETEDCAPCKRMCRSIKTVPGNPDQMDIVLYDCQIDPQWIEKIEESLPFVVNALQESRQFILRQGDVVPIEKVRRVSRASVEHLSRHSDLITRMPEPQQAPIPDKLYMTENVGTYAVYENRFLYMLLLELRDFLSYRYRKIREIAESFSARIKLHRELADGPRSIRYQLTFEESNQTPEELLPAHLREAICRIGTLLQEVDLLLKTPLMIEVSAAPLLRPPITRTNVLLHNPNFVAAFGLYSYLTEYEGDGFRSIERKHDEHDTQAQTKQEIASLVSLTSYLSHRWSGLRDTLEDRFAAAQALRKEQAEQEQKARLARLKAQAGEGVEAAFAYMLELERRNEVLETYSAQIQSSKELYQNALAQLEEATQAQQKLQGQISLLQTSILDKEHLLRQADDIKAQLQQTIQKQLVKEEEHINALRQEFDLTLKKQNDQFLQEHAALAESLRLENARYHAREGSEEELSSQEAFAELEAEYAAFRRFYKQQWKAAKRQIQQTHLHGPK